MLRPMQACSPSNNPIAAGNLGAGLDRGCRKANAEETSEPKQGKVGSLGYLKALVAVENVEALVVYLAMGYGLLYLLVK